MVFMRTPTWNPRQNVREENFVWTYPTTEVEGCRMIIVTAISTSAQYFIYCHEYKKNDRFVWKLLDKVPYKRIVSEFDPPHPLWFLFFVNIWKEQITMMSYKESVKWAFIRANLARRKIIRNYKLKKSVENVFLRLSYSLAWQLSGSRTKTIRPVTSCAFPHRCCVLLPTYR